MRAAWCLAIIVALFASELAADKLTGASGEYTTKFDVHGTTLVYNTNNVTGDGYAEIEGADIEELRLRLRLNPNIKTLELTSVGGPVWAGDEMARIVLDYGLNTRVEGECSSSCVNIFLAGATREMTRGSRIGFHQYGWQADWVETYYKEWREEENWPSPYDFASWLYQDTQHETAIHLEYMIERGVDPLFAIETKKSRPSMWFPPRSALVDAGVLRD